MKDVSIKERYKRSKVRISSQNGGIPKLYAIVSKRLIKTMLIHSKGLPLKGDEQSGVKKIGNC